MGKNEKGGVCVCVRERERERERDLCYHTPKTPKTKFCISDLSLVFNLRHECGW
jgi:hypothetical protein